MIGKNLFGSYTISKKSARSLAALDKVDAMGYLVESISEAIGSTVIKTMSHKFSPIGVTSIAIISESHISLHSFPEFQRLTVDIFCCNCDVDLAQADVCIRRILDIEESSYVVVERF